MTIDVNQGTDLAALHQAIVTASAQAFPGVRFEFYRQERVEMPFGSGATGEAPRAYCLLELVELEPADEDPGTEQQAMEAKFEASMVMKTLRQDARLDVRVLAGQFAAFLRRQSRFSPADVLQGQAVVTGCYRDDFKPELDQYEVWTVSWTQRVFLGTGVWFNDGTRPERVFLGFWPLVGIPHEPDYIELKGLPE